MIAAAPWKLTPLTARIFGLEHPDPVQRGFHRLRRAVERTRILMESAMVSVILCIIALPRMWNDFNFSNPMAYALVAGLVLTLIAFIAIHLWLDRLSQHTSKNVSATA